MTYALIEGLLGYQSRSGAFRSTLELRHGVMLQDETSLFTAQVCLILMRPGLASECPRLRLALEQGLDFIESCICPADDAWVHMHRPSGQLPTLQTTALAWLALVQSGRRPGDVARQRLRRVLEATRVDRRRSGDPDWVTAGLCRSWPEQPQTHRLRYNPVDLVANIHLAACCRLAGLPTQERALNAITQVCVKGDLSPEGLARISPFAATPAEIEFALERAVRAGQDALVPALKSMRHRKFGKQDRLARRPSDRPLHSMPGGAPRWFAPSLQLARWLYDLSHGGRPAPDSLQLGL